MEDVAIVLDGVRCRGTWTRYRGGQLGIQFYAAEDSVAFGGVRKGDAMGRPTIRIPEMAIGARQCLVRFYDEHLAAFEGMLAAGVIQVVSLDRGGGITPSGEVLCDVVGAVPPVDPADCAELREES